MLILASAKLLLPISVWPVIKGVPAVDVKEHLSAGHAGPQLHAGKEGATELAME